LGRRPGRQGRKPGFERGQPRTVRIPHRFELASQPIELFPDLLRSRLLLR
jgi:hypothetical protein